MSNRIQPPGISNTQSECGQPQTRPDSHGLFTIARSISSATITHRGSTWSLQFSDQAVSLQFAYAVSLPIFIVLRDIYSPEELASAVIQFVLTYGKLFADLRVCVGTWKTDEFTEISVSVVCLNFADAKTLANRWGQQYIQCLHAIPPGQDPTIYVGPGRNVIVSPGTELDLLVDLYRPYPNSCTVVLAGSPFAGLVIPSEPISSAAVLPTHPGKPSQASKPDDDGAPGACSVRRPRISPISGSAALRIPTFEHSLTLT